MKKIDNFFTENDCKWFQWYHNVLPETRDNGLRIQTMTHFAQPFFARKLKQIQSLLPDNEEVTTLNINFDYGAGGIHSDGYLEHDKNDKIAYNNLAWTKRKINDNYGAIFYATKAIEIDPN